MTNHTSQLSSRSDHRGEQGGVFCEVDSKLGYAHASAGGFKHLHGAADFHGDAGVGGGLAADFFCVARCYAVLVGDDVVAVEAFAVCCYFVIFQVGFCREQVQLVLGQVAGYEVGVDGSDEATAMSASRLVSLLGCVAVTSTMRFLWSHRPGQHYVIPQYFPCNIMTSASAIDAHPKPFGLVIKFIGGYIG